MLALGILYILISYLISLFCRFCYYRFTDEKTMGQRIEVIQLKPPKLVSGRAWLPSTLSSSWPCLNVLDQILSDWQIRTWSGYWGFHDCKGVQGNSHVLHSDANSTRKQFYDFISKVHRKPFWNESTSLWNHKTLKLNSLNHSLSRSLGFLVFIFSHEYKDCFAWIWP